MLLQVNNSPKNAPRETLEKFNVEILPLFSPTKINTTMFIKNIRIKNGTKKLDTLIILSMPPKIIKYVATHVIIEIIGIFVFIISTYKDVQPASIPELAIAKTISNIMSTTITKSLKINLLNDFKSGIL